MPKFELGRVVATPVSSALRSGHFRGVARASPPKVDRGEARARARFGHGVRQREAGQASRVMW
jgi:hypothetical protein